MRALKSGVIYIIGNLAAAAVPLLMLPLLTRVLTPGDYGKVIAFSLFVTLCQCVSGLNGHAALGVVWFRRDRAEVAAYTGTVMAIAVSSTLIVAGLAYGGLAAFPNLMPSVAPAWGGIAALTAGANIILQSRLIIWQSEGKAMNSALTQIAGSVINVGLSLLLVLGLHQGGDGRNLAISGAAMGMAAAGFLSFMAGGEIKWAPTREQLRYLAFFGLPLVFHSLAGLLLSTADRWLVSMKLDAAALGVYGAGSQLGMSMAVLGDAFVKTYSPWLYGRLQRGDEDGKLSAVGAIYAIIPLFFVVACALGGALILASGLLLGQQYRAASAYTPWFMLGGAFNGAYLCTSVLFFHNGRTGLLAVLSSSSGVIGAFITYALISWLGVTGAAMAYACSQALLASLTTIVAMRTFDLPWGSPKQALMAWMRDTRIADRFSAGANRNL